MNREELKKIMPHREPMLLLDSACAIDESSGQGSYKVRGDEFFLQGHYPDNPIVPAVILCEIIAQSACAVLANKLTDGIPYFTGLNNVRVRNKVVPGDIFDTQITLTNQKPPFYFFKGKGLVNGKACIDGEFYFAVVPKQ